MSQILTEDVIAKVYESIADEDIKNFQRIINNIPQNDLEFIMKLVDKVMQKPKKD